MKFAHYIVMALGFVVGAANAQPQSPADAAREQRAAQREYGPTYLGDQRSYDSIEARRRAWEQRRYCREWRERVERHPRLRLPRECWR